MMNTIYRLLWGICIAFVMHSTARTQPCTIDTSSTDIIFLIDNGQSIDDSEFAIVEKIVTGSIQKIRNRCPFARISIVHYGGANGNNTVIEYPLSYIADINSLNRQFCTSRNSFGFCVGGGGDDLNSACGNILNYLANKELAIQANNNLEIVILTDAYSLDTLCSFSNCSLIRPFTNIDLLKSSYSANVSVVGISSQADASQLAVYASPGGTYASVNLIQPDCGSSADGCGLPRKYIPIDWSDPITVITDKISNSVNCSFAVQGILTISAGNDVSICSDQNQSTTLNTSILSGTPPYSYSWSHFLGFSPSASVSPFVSTNYSVTVTDANGCTATDSVFVQVNSCGSTCGPDATSNDFIILIDNGQSIDDIEFLQLKNIVLSTIATIRDSCPASRIGVLHFGGSYGSNVNVEHNLSTSPISNITRQFCTSRDLFGICNDGGGDNLNGAIGKLLEYLDQGQISLSPKNKFSLIIFSDAFGFDSNCNFESCSLVRPVINIDSLKARYSAQVVVAGLGGSEASLLGIYASPGGNYFQSPLYSPDCAQSIDGCVLPRKLVLLQFNSNTISAALQIKSCIDCKVPVSPKLLANAGTNQTICGNYGESSTLMASAQFGTPPYSYSWSHNLGTGATKVVKPSSTLTFIVTVTDAASCSDTASVTVTVNQCNSCRANAGTPLGPKEQCMEGSRASFLSEKNNNLFVPTNYELVYLLTNSQLTILDYSVGQKNFLVFSPGTYRVHSFVAETSNLSSPDYFRLSSIVKGVSNLFDVFNTLNSKPICADIDLGGRAHVILDSQDSSCKKYENSISLCTDGRDNDGDGLIDCNDPDCKTLVNCLENSFLACNDLFDNDLDGLVDCYDPDCWSFVRCYERGDLCGDGKDNDGDGLIDCNDPDCIGARSCIENDAFTCSDGKDNDGNGLTDCQEASCKKYLVCAEYSIEACTDGKDNDLDGLIDCSDSHCREVLPSVCVLNENSFALCSDNKDNDGDGLIDCADPGCSSFSMCSSISGFIATATLDISAFLQGPLDPLTGFMSTDLNDQGYLPGQKPVTFFGKPTPAGQPFSDAPWFYPGDEGKEIKNRGKTHKNLYEKDVVDWILVSLRSTPEKNSEIWKAAGLIHSDGHISLGENVRIPLPDVDGYYIVLEHRNHLPAMSNVKIRPDDSGVIRYDFRLQDSYSGVFGFGQKPLQGGLFALIAGNGEMITELSSDIDINARDLTAWLFNNGANSSYFLEDYDMNGDINIRDRILWENNNGLFSSIKTK